MIDKDNEIKNLISIIKIYAIIIYIISKLIIKESYICKIIFTKLIMIYQ